MATQGPAYVTDIIAASGVSGENVETAFIMLKDLVASARQKAGIQSRAIFYVVKDADVARLRQAYIGTNSDIEAKIMWRTADPNTYSVRQWMVVLQWFDVVVLTEEILINLLKHPLLDFRVEFLLIADDCNYHKDDEHCFDSILSHFTECTQDSTYAHAVSLKSVRSFEMKRRPARRPLEWYHGTVNPNSDIQEDDETWRWCGIMPEDRVIDLGNWIFDALDSDYENLMLLEQHQNDTIYKVQSSGAILTLWSAPSILYMYCASLPVSETDISQRLPVFEMVESRPPYRLDCWLTLPQTSFVQEARSSIFTTKDLGARHAAFKACKVLHREGHLDDMFLPNAIPEVEIIEIIEIEDEPVQEFNRGMSQLMSHVQALEPPREFGMLQQPIEQPWPVSIVSHHASFEVGRAFIKMLLAVDHFIRHPTYNEGQLTRCRQSETVQIRDRSQVYIVVGDAYLSEGIEKALSEALKFLQPMPGIECWTDFADSFWQFRRGVTRADPASFRGVPDLTAVENILGYVFKDKSLLLEALSQQTTSAGPSHQRLEYLGDAILEVAAVVFWVVRFPKGTGYMVKVLKEESVSNKALQVVCLANGLDQYIWNRSMGLDLSIAQARISVQEAKLNLPNKVYWRKVYLCKPLADVVESILGAIFLDCGLKFSAIANVLERIQWPIIGRPLIAMVV